MDSMPNSRKTGAHTKMGQTGGSKQVAAQFLRIGQPASIFKADTDRVYDRCYTKIEEPTEYPDTVSPFVGNPLAI